jgi:hypothetical protein
MQFIHFGITWVIGWLYVCCATGGSFLRMDIPMWYNREFIYRVYHVHLLNMLGYEPLS